MSNGVVDAADLGTLLGQWGARGSAADLDGDGDVGPVDLALLLGSWGACPPALDFGVSKEGGVTLAFIASGGGQPICSVAFDPATGTEDYATQRLLGFSSAELEALEDIGDPALLLGESAEAAATLWSDGIADGGLTPVEKAVLGRQSQLFAAFRDLVLPLSTSGASDDCPCQLNECTLVPDFWFGDECNQHDICYCLGGEYLQRLECDQALRDAITQTGPPVVGGLVGELYFRGVRAFGWAFFSFGRPLGACCVGDGPCQLVSAGECALLGGTFQEGQNCVCEGPYGPLPYGPECPYYSGSLQAFGARPLWQGIAAAVLALLMAIVAGAARWR